MSISPELFSAILAMDAYNRGYKVGIQPDGKGKYQGLTGTMIGNYTIGNNSSILVDEVTEKRLDIPASFFAQSYTLRNKDTKAIEKTIISYRGTDSKIDILTRLSTVLNSKAFQVVDARDKRGHDAAGEAFYFART
jgi:hypothetical protein